MMRFVWKSANMLRWLLQVRSSSTALTLKSNTSVTNAVYVKYLKVCQEIRRRSLGHLSLFVRSAFTFVLNMLMLKCLFRFINQWDVPVTMVTDWSVMTDLLDLCFFQVYCFRGAAHTSGTHTLLSRRRKRSFPWTNQLRAGSDQLTWERRQEEIEEDGKGQRKKGRKRGR